MEKSKEPLPECTRRRLRDEKYKIKNIRNMEDKMIRPILYPNEIPEEIKE